jgi:hypothetical protein
VIHFETSYLVKCYLREVGSEAVRELAAGQTSIVCCEYGRLELVVAFHGNFREGLLTKTQYRTVLHQFESDDASGTWIWLSVSADLLRKAAARVISLPSAASCAPVTRCISPAPRRTVSRRFIATTAI